MKGSEKSQRGNLCILYNHIFTNLKNDQNYLGCQYHTLNSVVFVQECLPNLLLSLAIGNLHLVAWTLFLACMVWVLFQYQFFFSNLIQELSVLG